MHTTATTRVGLVLMLALLGADTPTAKLGQQAAADKTQLEPLKDYVGQWRGTGMPQRSSTQGAWIETADWAWSFREGRAALGFQAPQGKHFASGQILPGAKTGEFELVAIVPGQTQPARFVGHRENDGPWVFEAADESQPGDVDRITLRQVAGGDRLVMLLEKRLGSSNRFGRLAEVGYTRVGSGFGKGVTMRECVVTGGAGTMAVSYKGMTYYVCCTGCKDLFDEDPEGVLAEYRARKAKQQAETNR